MEFQGKVIPLKRVLKRCGGILSKYRVKITQTFRYRWDFMGLIARGSSKLTTASSVLTFKFKSFKILTKSYRCKFERLCVSKVDSNLEESEAKKSGKSDTWSRVGDERNSTYRIRLWFESWVENWTAWNAVAQAGRVLRCSSISGYCFVRRTDEPRYRLYVHWLHDRFFHAQEYLDISIPLSYGFSFLIRRFTIRYWLRHWENNVWSIFLLINESASKTVSRHN